MNDSVGATHLTTTGRSASSSPATESSDSPGVAPRRIAILGATGSVGRSALDVIRSVSSPPLLAYGLSAHSRVDELIALGQTHRPRYLAVTDTDRAETVRKAFNRTETEVLVGVDGLIRMVQVPEVDCVLTAIVGAAGLDGTVAAIEAGKTIALANKETLVLAGSLVMDLARRRGVDILPVDSEHAAIFQALQCGRRDEVRRVILTGSGGPFRGRCLSDLAEVTTEQALAHPTWKMGPKITIDSATMMNKALEVIEARWLFDLDPDQIEVVVHPQSVVHSMVEYVDGSVMAQLSPPDMRLPIQMALTYPERVDGPSPKLAIDRPWSLQFEPPDLETFPCLALGFEVMRRGGTAGAALNAANEVAVDRFLRGEIAFLDIPRICRATLDHHTFDPQPSLDHLRRVDRWARQEASRWSR